MYLYFIHCLLWYFFVTKTRNLCKLQISYNTDSYYTKFLRNHITVTYDAQEYWKPSLVKRSRTDRVTHPSFFSNFRQFTPSGFSHAVFVIRRRKDNLRRVIFICRNCATRDGYHGRSLKTIKHSSRWRRGTKVMVTRKSTPTSYRNNQTNYRSYLRELRNEEIKTRSIFSAESIRRTFPCFRCEGSLANSELSKQWRRCVFEWANV